MRKQLHKIALVGLLLGSGWMHSQIQQETLILDKKREPEVKKIEKKKTSVETIKNYPPEEKSAVPVVYKITNVPAASDFQTSAIAGSDIAPDFSATRQNNYFRLGYGNYSRFLADGNLSLKIDESTEVGADLHFLSTEGLKKDYAWDSGQSNASVGGFINSYGEKGKFGFDARYQLDDYNFYGIYAFNPESSIDLQQKVNEINVNGFYDFYSNQYLNDVRVKSSFLSDHFDSKENNVGILANLSKHDVALPLNNVKMNADLGVGLETLNTEFALLDKNETNFLNFELEPQVTFLFGESYLRIGSGFSFLNSKYSSSSLGEGSKSSDTYWFPKAEVLIAATPEFNFYAGIDGGLELNSYSQMLQEVPFLTPDQEIRPTETKYQFYFGIKGDIDQLFKYDLSGGYGKINNIQFFGADGLFDSIDTLNRSAYNFSNTFSALYDNGNVSNVKAEVSYFPLANLVVDGGFNYNSYKLDNYEKIYNVPEIKAHIGAKYALLNQKLILGMKGIFASSKTTNSFSYTQVENPLMPGSYFYSGVENRDDKVSGYMDLNLSAEYKVHKNFSIFALGNNLTGSKYEILKGYKVLGPQILGGIKLTF